MKRREFIKNTTLALSLCPFLSACTGEKDKFYLEDDQLPKHVRLDICTLCQLNCVECFMRKDEENIRKQGGFGYVDFETFKNFIDKHPFIEKINVSNHGEIFLNPDLDKILEYAYQKGVVLGANSGVNLNTISEETAENLVKYQFELLCVSIDGASQETYSIYRRGGDFNKVIENIKMINHFKEKYNSEFPIMFYKFIPFGHNEHEIEDAKKLAKELNMSISFDVNYAREYSPLKNPKKVMEQTGLVGLDYYIDDVYKRHEKTEGWFFCKSLFDEPQINFDGNLLGCCIQVNQGFGINVFKVGLKKALNSQKVLHAKHMVTDLSTPAPPDHICTHCQVYKYLKENNCTLAGV